MKDSEAVIACIVGCLAIVGIVTNSQYIPISVSRMALAVSIIMLFRFTKNKLGKK